YLAGWLTPILAGQDFVTGRLAVVITADEDDSSQGNRVLTAVLHRSLDGAHLVTGTALNHYSLAAFYAKIVGMVPVRDAATAADMAAAFKL
ncbi:MAG: phosphoesterase, partial [Acidimicrobiia bacterium]|nr:phosphoesterase [Acidimicrobiia bacterium]